MVIVFDLDDTLYDEIDFVKSGFREISKYLGDEKYFNFMWEEFLKNGSGKIFDKLINDEVWMEEVRNNDHAHPRENGYDILSQYIYDWSGWWFA
jgi:FMN phosphatase YigB (HAD superfamily)